MNYHIKAILALVVIAQTATASEFLLRDEAAHRLYGPFKYRQHETITVGTNQFTLLVRDKAHLPHITHEERLKRIIFPSVDFDAVPLSSVVDFLVKDSVKEDPYALGINIVLSCPQPEPTVTIHAKRISLYELLVDVAHVTGLEIQIGESSVLILELQEEIASNKEVEATGDNAAGSLRSTKP